MGNSAGNADDRSAVLYGRLDRFLLYLIASEIGYLILLFSAGVVYAILVFFMDFELGIGDHATSILWPVLPFILAVPLNFVGAFVSLVLNIRTRHAGYPGTGHLLNWLYLATTAWLFLVALVFMLPAMAWSY